MCPGNPDARFTAMCQSRNGLIEAADGTVKAAVDSEAQCRYLSVVASSTDPSTAMHAKQCVNSGQCLNFFSKENGT